MATVPRFLRDPGGSFFLLGPPGTGKSTWLELTFPDAPVVDLLAPDTERRYLARPELLAPRGPGGAGSLRFYAGLRW